MVRIALTQRVDIAPPHAERRDALDQRWYPLLSELGISPILLPNDERLVRQLLASDRPDGFILTGGNDLASTPGATQAAPERDAVERYVLEFARNEKLPVVGVCRGMQMINDFLGGRMIKVQGHAGIRHPLTGRQPLLAGHEEVNSFHNWGFTAGELAKDLVVQLTGPSQVVEAMTHKTLPWIGIMWHPEREPTLSASDAALFNRMFKK
jgi:gamma-glutamyl-gamma-aminobutyrate hydrolase PuuD